MSYRRLAVLISGLPPESWTKAELLDALPPEQLVADSAGHGPWSREMHLLARVIDELSVANWQRGGDDKVPPPAPTPRPGLTAPEPAVDPAASAKARKYTDRLRAGHGSIN